MKSARCFTNDECDDGMMCKTVGASGLGKPAIGSGAPQVCAFDWDPVLRITSGPAVMNTAQAGRIHDLQPTKAQIARKAFVQRAPSAHDPRWTLLPTPILSAEVRCANLQDLPNPGNVR